MATFINNLDPTKPSSVDPVAEGAEEIRAIKQALKDSFPYATSPLTVSNEALNTLAKETVNEIAASMDALEARIAALESA